MEIFREDKETGISCGVNDRGDLFLGDSKSGYNMKNTPENRDHILSDFNYWTEIRRAHPYATYRRSHKWKK